MLKQISKSDRFQSEVLRYNSVIDQMPDGLEKTEIKNLVKELSLQVKKMDDMHVEMIFTRQLPSLGQEFRDKIQNLRKELDKKIKYQEQKLMRKNHG